MLYELKKRMQKDAAWTQDGVVGNFVHHDSLSRADAFFIFLRGLIQAVTFSFSLYSYYLTGHWLTWYKFVVVWIEKI